MKYFVRLLVAVIGVSIGSASAQTNYFWTNSFSDLFSNSLNWTNELANGNGPASTNPSGSNDYALSFVNAGNTYTATNDLGTFLLNQLLVNNVALTITGGTLSFATATSGALPQFTVTGASNVTIQSAIVLATSTTFSVTSTGILFLAGGISGTGGLIKTSAGTLTFAGPNTYTGLTILNNAIANGRVILSNTTGSGNAIAGNIQLGSGGAGNNIFLRLAASEQIADTSIMSFNASGTGVARFELLGFNETIGGLAAPANIGVIENADNTGTGPASETNAGPSTLTLNVATGTNLIYGGFLRNAGSLAGPSNTLSVVKTGAGTQTFAGANIGSLASITVSNGVLILTNTTALVSALTVNGGQLQLANATTLNSSPVTNNAPNGLGFISTNAFTVGSLNGNSTGSIALTNDSAVPVTLTVGTGNASGSFTGAITDAGALIKTGTGTQILAGPNTFAGGITLSAGTLAINNPTALGSGTFTITAGTIDNSTAGVISNTQNNALNWNGDFTFTGTHSLNLGTGPVTLSSNRTVTVTANALTVGGTITDGGNSFILTKSGAGILALTAANALAPDIALTISAGTLDLGNNTQFSTNTLTVSGGTLQNGTYSNDTTAILGQSGTISANLAGAAGLIKTTTGTLTLSGNNTYAGLTVIQAGSVILANNNALGATTAGTVVSNNASLSLTNGITVTGETVYLSGSGGDSFGALRATASSTGTWTGPVVLNDASNTPRIGGLANSKLTITGPITNGLGSTLYISVQNGSGTVVIANTNNTYTGVTGIIRGTLQLGADNALPTGTTLDMEPTTPVTESSVFDLNGHNQTIAGLKNSQTPSNGMFIANTSSTNATLTINQTNTSTYSGFITNNVNLIKTGSGTLILSSTNSSTGSILVNAGVLTLSGANSFSGGTTLSNGTLNINNASALGTGPLTIFAGNIDNSSAAILTNSQNNAMNWNGDFTFTGTHSLNLGTGPVTLSSNRIVTINTSGLTVGGNITDGGNSFVLTKAGSGTFFIAGANALAPDIGVTMNTGTLDFGGTTQFSTNTFTLIAGTVQNGTLSNNAAFAVQAGTISANLAGSAALTKTTTNTATLSGTNTFTGGVTLNSGTLNINNASALGSGTFTITGGAFNNTTGSPLTNSQNNAMAWNGDFTFVGGNGLNLGTGPVTMNSNRNVTVTASVLTVGGNISDGGNNFVLTKAGAGTLVLSAANALAPDIALTMTAGTLDFAGNTQFSTNTFTFTGGTVQNGTLSNNSAFAAQAGTISANLAGSAALTKTTTNTATLAGTNTFTGGTTISAGILQINSPISLPVGTGSVVVPFGSTFAAGYAIDTNFINAVSTTSSGVVALATTSANPLDFSVTGANLTNVSLGAVGSVYYNGPLTPFGTTYRLGGGGGTLNISNNLALTGANSLIAFSSGSGGVLQINGSNTYTGGTIILGGTVTVSADTAFGATIGASNIVINGGTINNSNGSGLTTTRGIAIGSNGGTFTTTGGNFNLNGAIINVAGQTGTVTFASGTIVPGAQSTFSGNLVLLGTLVVPTVSSVGTGATMTSGPFGIGTLVFAGGQIRATTGNNITIGNNILFQADTTVPSFSPTKTLTFTGSVTLTNATRTFTQSSGAGGTVTFSGPIGEATPGLGFTKAGTSLVVFSGTNTYSGPTTVSAGTLQFASTAVMTDTPTITVASGAALNVSAFTSGFALAPNQTLTGAGLVTGSVTAVNGPTIAPGALTNTIGTLTFTNNLTLNNATLTIGVNATGGTADVLAVINALTITNSTLTLVTTGPLVSNAYVFASYGSLASSNFAFTTINNLDAGYTINYNYNNLSELALVQIPEPSTLSLALFGLAAAFITRRSRKP